MSNVTTETKRSYRYKAVVITDYNGPNTVKAGTTFYFTSQRDLKAATEGGSGLRVSLEWDAGAIIPPVYLQVYRLDYETVTTITETVTKL